MRTFHDLAQWYFSKKALPYWGILLFDCTIVLFSFLFAYALVHGAAFTLAMGSDLFPSLILTLASFMVSFRIFHTYYGVIRYSSFVDLMRVAAAVIIALMIIAVAQLGLSNVVKMHIGMLDILLSGMFTASLMWMTRMWVKTMYDDSVRGDKVQKVFILGVKSGGVSIAKSIRGMANGNFKIEGFVTAERDMVKHRLLGCKVYPFDENLPELMVKKNIKALIVSPLMMDYITQHESMVDALVNADIKILVKPRALEWDGKSDITASELRPVDVEDLLPRPKIEVDMTAASEMLNGHVVMISGAAGSIGSEMVRQVASYKPSLMILVDQAETPMHDIRLMMHNEYPDVQAETIVADISDERMMHRLFARHKPEYVFHAAAYKHVPMMEDNPYESVTNNISGTKILADLAVKYGTKKFVMVSTDKAVNPTNVMGCSKRICEIYVQSLDKAIKDGKVKGITRFVTTRFGNVLGSNGSVIPIFQEQIRRGGPVTVTHPDIIRYFMLIPEACKLVIEAGTMGNGGEIFVFDMGEPVRIADLAKRMIKLSGARGVEIKYTGLRDGEKLYEELLNDKEATLPSFNPKINIARVREYNFPEVSDAIGSLIDSAPTKEDMHIVADMKTIVPEFRSQNSKYCALDQ